MHTCTCASGQLLLDEMLLHSSTGCWWLQRIGFIQCQKQVPVPSSHSGSHMRIFVSANCFQHDHDSVLHKSLQHSTAKSLVIAVCWDSIQTKQPCLAPTIQSNGYSWEEENHKTGLQKFGTASDWACALITSPAFVHLDGPWACLSAQSSKFSRPSPICKTSWVAPNIT